MNAPVAPLHSPFGGSVAGRVLACPASVRLIERVPDCLRRISAYALRGTALHTTMAHLIERECTLDSLINKTIGDYTITDDDVEISLRPVLGYVDGLLDQDDAQYYLERRVT